MQSCNIQEGTFPTAKVHQKKKKIAPIMTKTVLKKKANRGQKVASSM